MCARSLSPYYSDPGSHLVRARSQGSNRSQHARAILDRERDHARVLRERHCLVWRHLQPRRSTALAVRIVERPSAFYYDFWQLLTCLRSSGFSLFSSYLTSLFPVSCLLRPWLPHLGPSSLVLRQLWATQRRSTLPSLRLSTLQNQVRAGSLRASVVWKNLVGFWFFLTAIRRCPALGAQWRR